MVISVSKVSKRNKLIIAVLVAVCIALVVAIGSQIPIFRAETEEGRYEQYSAMDWVQLQWQCRDLWVVDK